MANITSGNLNTPTNNSSSPSSSSSNGNNNNNNIMRGFAPVVIGVAGGTGCGKSSLAKRILSGLGEENVTTLCHDFYYKDISHLSLEERAKNNFDHPHALDTKLLVEHVEKLKRGESVEVPRYNFSTHSREDITVLTKPKSIILVEGILIFTDPSLRKQMDIKIYVDTQPDIRFIRRLQRDISERGRTTESVIQQYLTTVKPMHDEFVEPTKRFADVIIPNDQNNGLNETAVSMVLSRLHRILDGNEPYGC